MSWYVMNLIPYSSWLVVQVTNNISSYVQTWLGWFSTLFVAFALLWFVQYIWYKAKQYFLSALHWNSSKDQWIVPNAKK